MSIIGFYPLSKAVANVLMPSSRPSKPNFSVVVAFTLTCFIFNTTCNQLLNDYLTSRNVEILIDLKEHVMYIGVIYKYITQNHPSEPKLIEIKDKFKYYKEWIINESDMSL